MSGPVEPTPGPLLADESYGLAPVAGPKHRGWGDVLDAVADARSWWICSSRAGGRPHAMPVWGVVVEGRMVFATGPDTVKAKNLRRTPDMVMHLESGDDVVIVEAEARAVRGTALPPTLPADYEAKYGLVIDDVDDPGYLWFELLPKVVFSWDEGDFADTAVRFTF